MRNSFSAFVMDGDMPAQLMTCLMTPCSDANFASSATLALLEVSQVL